LKDYEQKQLQDVNDLNFNENIQNNDIRIYTNKILQQNLVTEIMTITFQFPVGNLAFNCANIIMKRIKRITNLALEVIATYFQFYLKFEFDITLINIESVKLIVKTISFPDHIKNKDFEQVFTGLTGLFNYLENAPLQKNTKKKLHETKDCKKSLWRM